MTAPLVPPPGSGIEVHDLASIASGDLTAPAPTLGGRGDDRCLLYPEALHWLSGEPGAGKTWLALDIVAEVLRHEGQVIIVDYEGTAAKTAARLLALSVEVSELARLLYLSPAGRMGDAGRSWLGSVVHDHPVQLVVIDSAAEALAAAGFSEDDAGDVTAWIAAFPRLLARAGAAVIVVDHVAKSEAGRGRWPRGSGAKLAACDVAFTLDVTEPFSRERSGRGVLTIAKDRDGSIGAAGETAADIVFQVAGGSLHRVRLDPPGTFTPGPTVPDGVALRLEQAGGRWDSAREAAAALDVSTNEVTRVLRRAVDTGAIVEIEAYDPRRMTYRSPRQGVGDALTMGEF
jgi:hypothetical protein